MSHVACMPGNWVDSRLLVIGSQTASLTLDISFGHNLCFKCPNGLCKPIIDIYASIVFQWFKELFKAMGFDPCNCALKIWKSIWDSNSEHGSSFGSVRVHSLTLFWHTRKHVMCDSQVFLFPCNLLTPCLGHEPKARVATHIKSTLVMILFIKNLWYWKKFIIISHMRRSMTFCLCNMFSC
jgi:hypothetical protein